MKLLGTASTIALISLTAPLMALDLGGGFSITGNVELEYLNDGSDDETFGILDADLVYEHANGFGGFVGVDAFGTSSSTEETIYGALSYSGSFGKIQIGAPRNALDDYVVSPEIGGVDVLDISLGGLSGSILPAVLIGSDEAATGLRYDGSFGSANVGVSYLDFEDAKILDAAMTYNLGETKLMAGLERASSSGSESTAYFLGAEHDFGQVTAGAILGHSDLFASSGADSFTGYAVYSATDRLDLTASVLTISASGSDAQYYGLAANYELSEALYVEAGYVTASSSFGGDDDFFALSVGMNF
ncbi:MAG TPA: hypothetical protein PKA03_05625 [Tabrizicola sp.]|nr:hypothetical protein [Tabrizicola sp.]